jgi:hypothetical protein
MIPLKIIKLNYEGKWQFSLASEAYTYEFTEYKF